MPLTLLTQIQPFVIALALGLLIGIERERSHPPGLQAVGSRTFVLFSLLGAIVARLNQPLPAIGITLFVGGIIIAGYFRSSRKETPDVGITTEVAAMVTYGLGYLAYSEAFIALLLGVVVFVVLLARTSLHEFSRTQIRASELQATATLLILALGIIPFLPDRTIDPWNLFNPQRFGILILIIAILQFAAYLAMRIFGSAHGLLLSGFLSGFVSSTAATATLAHLSKKKSAHPFSVASAVIFSTIAMFVKLIVVISLASPNLLYTVSLPAIGASLVLGLFILSINFYALLNNNELPPPENPLALASAIRLAIFLGSMIILITLAQRVLGPTGTQAVAFLGGLVQIQGVILAIANLYHEGQIGVSAALNGLSIAVIASFLSKYIIAWGIARNRFSIYLSILMAVMLVVYIVIWALVSFYLTTQS